MRLMQLGGRNTATLAGALSTRFFAGKTLAFDSSHGNDKMIYEIKSTANSCIAVCSSTALQRDFNTAGTNVTRRTAVRNILTKRLRRVRGARLFANC